MKTFLDVPFSDNAEAKRLGAKWSSAYRKWFIENVENIDQFMKWMPIHLKAPSKGVAK